MPRKANGMAYSWISGDGTRKKSIEKKYHHNRVMQSFVTQAINGHEDCEHAFKANQL
jgi:hypothetical protein